MGKKLFLNERFILLIILLNSAIIFIEGFNFHITDRLWLDLLDNGFTIIFLVELLVKIREYGAKGYFKSNWNIFDFTLVMLALPSLSSLFVTAQIIDLDFLLAFRTMRIFKFFRFIRFVPKIDKIISGVMRASKASVLIIIAFFIFNFTISIISCFLFRDISPEYFSNPLISFYSIFKVFTIEGWYEIPDEMTQDSSPLLAFLVRLYFIIILFVGGIFGLSLVNSIFVDAMVSENNVDLENEVRVLNAKIDRLLEMRDEELVK
ncbi:ion transporter [Litoribacter populi]|uniref:ion transporter n=1 Tax=Litoribacter populi TaxID=2598460 RepID=UPI00117D7B47|nr:ion transporter [Litoribacter populi]